MRFILIVSMFFISITIYAQQERQMVKPDAVQKNMSQKSSDAVVTTSSTRQMARAGDKATVKSTGNSPATTVVSGDQKREMAPLNPNQVVKKKN